MNKGKVSILFTIIVTVVATIVVGVIVIYFVGTEKTTKTVSPLVERTKDRITDGVVPEMKRGDEPKTDADMIMDAVAANNASVVTIYKNDEQTEGDGQFVARGIMVSSDGLVVTDSGVVKEDNEYIVRVPGVRDTFDVDVVLAENGVLLLKIDTTTSMVAHMDDVVLEQEQLVVAITGDEKMRIATGVILSVDEYEDIVSTNIVGEIAPGTPLISKNGNVIGMSTTSAQTSDKASFLSAKVLKDVIASIEDDQELRE